MLEQPAFGRRLRRLRTDRGLTQSALVGDGMSTGYLSRLESGDRQPTERAVRLLADRLGIDPAEFQEPEASPLAESLTVATGLGPDEAGRLLTEALGQAGPQDPLTRWQALWLVAEWRRRRGERAEERAHLDELVDLSERIGLPELRVRALTQLARCRRASGEVPAAVETATAAHRLAVAAGSSAQTTASALLALVSATAEAGRIPEARRHADELIGLVAGRSDALWAEALWTAAAVRVRQGELAAARELLDQAMTGFDGREDFTLWLRLRLAAANLRLLTTPPEPAAALRYVEAVEACLPFAGTPALEQALTALRARIAFHEGRIGEARTLLDRLDGTELLMGYRERVELDVLRNQLLLLDGRNDEAMAGLRALAQQAQEDANVDLAAEIWRLAAEALAARPRD